MLLLFRLRWERHPAELPVQMGKILLSGALTMNAPVLVKTLCVSTKPYTTARTPPGSARQPRAASTKRVASQ